MTVYVNYTTSTGHVNTLIVFKKDIKPQIRVVVSANVNRML